MCSVTRWECARAFVTNARSMLPRSSRSGASSPARESSGGSVSSCSRSMSIAIAIASSAATRKGAVGACFTATSASSSRRMASRSPRRSSCPSSVSSIRPADATEERSAESVLEQVNGTRQRRRCEVYERGRLV